MTRNAGLGILLVLAAAQAFAQGRSVTALATSRNVSPDDMDDPIWNDAVPTDALLQQKPDEGRTATVRTECGVLATPRALMLARWLADPATDVFAVFDRQIGAGFARPGTSVTLKVRRSFNL